MSVTKAIVTVDLSDEFAEDRASAIREVRREGFEVKLLPGNKLVAEFAEANEDERNHSTRSEYTELLDDLGLVYSTEFEEEN